MNFFTHVTIYPIYWHNVKLIFVSSTYLSKNLLKEKDVDHFFTGTKTLRKKIECKDKLVSGQKY